MVCMIQENNNGEASTRELISLPVSKGLGEQMKRKHRVGQKNGGDLVLTKGANPPIASKMSISFRRPDIFSGLNSFDHFLLFVRSYR